MPNLISQELYDETIELIEGNKEPDILLKEMQQWYSGRGVTLYNIYFEKDIYKNHATYGKYEILILSDLYEGFFMRGSKKNIYKESLDKFLEICRTNHIYQNHEWANVDYPNPGISGYYFPRIWKNEVISEIGQSLCPELEKRYVAFGIEKVVNSGYGAYTVFFCGDTLEEKYQNEIIDYVNDYVTEYDNHHLITDKDQIVQFDKISVLEEVYHGNLYQYYK